MNKTRNNIIDMLYMGELTRGIAIDNKKLFEHNATSGLEFTPMDYNKSKLIYMDMKSSSI